MYKQFNYSDKTLVKDAILRIVDNATIPFDEANTDYQAYLKWVAEGNTPLPAENE
jgi:hypothetical protein